MIKDYNLHYEVEDILKKAGYKVYTRPQEKRAYNKSEMYLIVSGFAVNIESLENYRLQPQIGIQWAERDSMNIIPGVREITTLISKEMRKRYKDNNVEITDFQLTGVDVEPLAQLSLVTVNYTFTILIYDQ